VLVHNKIPISTTWDIQRQTGLVSEQRAYLTLYSAEC